MTKNSPTVINTFKSYLRNSPTVINVFKSYFRNSPTLINAFKSYLSSCFHNKVAKSPSGIYLCQQKYALDIIAEMGLLSVKPVSFPL